VESTEILSCAELKRRFRTIVADSSHLKSKLPLDSPHNALLRLIDVARYIGGPRASMDGDAYLKRHQRALSLFFKAWDHGNLVKARIGDTWQIIHRHTGTTSLAQVAPAPREERPIQCRIDLSVIGRNSPRLKVL
jgi:hypothetical protein